MIHLLLFVTQCAVYSGSASPLCLDHNPRKYPVTCSRFAIRWKSRIWRRDGTTSCGVRAAWSIFILIRPFCPKWVFCRVCAKRSRAPAIGLLGINVTLAVCFPQAYLDLVKKWGWKSFTIIYESNEGLVRLQELLKARNAALSAYPITIRQLGSGRDHRWWWLGHTWD